MKLNSNRLFDSELRLLMVIAMLAVITYSFISVQFSFAPAPDEMTVDPKLHPENVTASISDLIIVTFSSGTGMRIPEPDKPVMEVSWAGVGSYRGTTNISDLGTVIIEPEAHGISRVHGQGMIMDPKGESATYTIQGIGRTGIDGYFRNHGIVLFNASSEGVFDHLSDTVGVFANEVNQKGNAVTKVWELK